MLDSPQKRVAATIVAGQLIANFIRQNLRIKTTLIGKGIVSTLLTMKKPSLLFGKIAKVLDRDKPHEVMFTRIDPKEVSIILSSNQGTPDSFMKHLKDHEAEYGAVVNGGFYAINGFYRLVTDTPIGLHRFNFNASSGKHLDKIKHHVDTTTEYAKHPDDALTAPYKKYEKDPRIPSELHLKTQTPNDVKGLYGMFRITSEGEIDLKKMTDFTDEHAFQSYLDEAEYLLSSGPILVSNNEVQITAQQLQSESRFQFRHIYERFGSHPSSVPPGTFYHADQLNPRSAIGITKDGELLMVTVKGEEDPSKRDGMKLDDFALLMKLLGAKIALNLDGGYSACQGVFNRSKMYQPQFMKKAGNESLLPCSIVAKQKTEINQSLVPGPSTDSEALSKSKRKIQFPA